VQEDSGEAIFVYNNAGDQVVSINTLGAESNDGAAFIAFGDSSSPQRNIFRGTLSTSPALQIGNTVESTNSSTGSIVTAGGVAVGKSLCVSRGYTDTQTLGVNQTINDDSSLIAIVIASSGLSSWTCQRGDTLTWDGGASSGLVDSVDSKRRIILLDNFTGTLPVAGVDTLTNTRNGGTASNITDVFSTQSGIVMLGDDTYTGGQSSRSVIIGHEANGGSSLGGSFGSVSIGYQANTSSAILGVAIGYQAGVSDIADNGIAIGAKAYVDNDDSIVVGSSDANSPDNIIIGHNSVINSSYNLCVGNVSQADNTATAGLGHFTYADSKGAVAVGTYAQSWYWNSLLEQGTVAIGPYALATNDDAGSEVDVGAIAIGGGASAWGVGATVIGFGSGSLSKDAYGFNDIGYNVDTVVGLSVGDHIGSGRNEAVITSIVGNTVYASHLYYGEWYIPRQTFTPTGGGSTYTIETTTGNQDLRATPSSMNYSTYVGSYAAPATGSTLEDVVCLGYGATATTSNTCYIGGNLTVITVVSLTGIDVGDQIDDGTTGASGKVLRTDVGFNRVFIHTTTAADFGAGNTISGAGFTTTISTVEHSDRGYIEKLQFGRGTQEVTVANPITLSNSLSFGGQSVDTIETTITDDDTHLPTSGAVVDYVATNSGGSPGGSTTQLQYNNAGSFGGTNNLTWDGSTLLFDNATKLVMQPSVSNTDVLEIRTTSGSFGTIEFNTGGFIKFGSGSTSPDTLMWRLGPGVLYCDGSWYSHDMVRSDDGFQSSTKTVDVIPASGCGVFYTKNQLPYHNYNGTITAIGSVTSAGTTGGTGSAGAGNQYVEVAINGTTYKLLHDGTV